MKCLKRSIIYSLLFIIVCGMLCGCSKKQKEDEDVIDSATSDVLTEFERKLKEQNEKGYNLPVDDSEREEAEKEGQVVMKLIEDIYINADKGDALNVTVSDATVMQMIGKIEKDGYAVTTNETYFNMRNYEQIDSFLKDSLEGDMGTIVLYEVHSDGGIGRDKYIFDGTDMYVVASKYSWNDEDDAVLTYISYTRIKEWKYTEKGWFCYELCVPEFPEVSEMVDGSRLIRVQPMTKENREFSKKYVIGLGYQGNNLLCSNWDISQLDKLDYNGMFEYLYSMKYQKKYNSEDYPDGIPKNEFESLIMEYIPITKEQIREYAVFDEEKQTYVWVRLGCFNYAPTFFGTSVPEVTNIKENEDGTITLTVDAVCEMILCDDAVITHELTVRFAEDGSYQYLGNEILDDGIMQIPDYQYRIPEE